MANTKSLYELKQEQFKKKNKNVITDADYFLRDKKKEALEGSPNTIDMTPRAPIEHEQVEAPVEAPVEMAKETAAPLTPKAPTSKAKV